MIAYLIASNCHINAGTPYWGWPIELALLCNLKCILGWYTFVSRMLWVDTIGVPKTHMKYLVCLCITLMYNIMVVCLLRRISAVHWSVKCNMIGLCQSCVMWFVAFWVILLHSGRFQKHVNSCDFFGLIRLLLASKWKVTSWVCLDSLLLPTLAGFNLRWTLDGQV